MSKTSVKLGNQQVSTVGRFRLRVLRPPKKFSLTNVPSYIPKGKTYKDMVRFMSPNGREVESLILDQISTILYPDTNEADAHNVRALIAHPKVRINGIDTEGWRKMIDGGFKAPRSEFEITNLDKQSLDEMDREADLVEARAILLSKRNPISVEKLKWLCTVFKLGYKEEIQDSERYRAELAKKLDGFIQDKNTIVKGKSNLERFMDAMDNITKTETLYYIAKLEKFEVITKFGGIYKVGERPVGASVEDVIRFYSDYPEIFAEHKKEVNNLLRSELA